MQLFKKKSLRLLEESQKSMQIVTRESNAIKQTYGKTSLKEVWERQWPE